VSYLPYLVILVLLGGLLMISMRNRRRQVAEEMVRVSRIGVGTEVMTTSGLYGTVVTRHDDGTVLLAIAPGVEVRWAAAALRDAESLADTYRRVMDADADADGEANDRASSETSDQASYEASFEAGDAEHVEAKTVDIERNEGGPDTGAATGSEGADLGKRGNANGTS
jgi:preprotein translocase subunit YajC